MALQSISKTMKSLL